jgi:hypothetical protein
MQNEKRVLYYTSHTELCPLRFMLSPNRPALFSLA